jgi:hypothetical protein
MTPEDIKGIVRRIIAEHLVTESMSVHIDGANYKRLDNLHDLCYRLLDLAVTPVAGKLPPDQMEYFKKNGVPYYETLTPDGDGFDKPTGTINFYISGFMSKAVQQILKYIFDELRKAGIKWGKIRKEQSNMFKSQVIRIPIVKNEQKYSGPPEMSLSNVNAYQIFHHILQYEGEHDFSMDAQELKDRIESLKGDKGWLKKHTMKPFDTKMEPKEPELPGDEWKHADDTKPDEDDPSYNPHMGIVNQIGGGLGARVVSSGLSEDDILQRLNYIWEIADWAVKHGHKKIHVG